MKIKLPDFLIVGAAKSGTTSVYNYLKQHPEIYMSRVKEPKFITAQFLEFPLRGIGDAQVEQKIVKNFKDYQKLFQQVNGQKAVGESSVDNLYFYEGAIKYIKRYLGDVRILIILRNPIERAFSQYNMFRSHGEYLSFEAALDQEEKRKGENWQFFWHYKSVGFYYKSVKAYMGNFSRVKICLYDDLEADPLGLMRDIYKFLNVDASFIPDMAVRYNISGVPKNKFIYNLLYRSNPFKNFILKPAAAIFLSEEKRKKFMEEFKTILFQKTRMRPETREYLKETYREDILSLQGLLGRDLSRWIK